MTFDDMQKEVDQYFYSEDKGLLSIPIASIISTRLKLGDPIWVVIIGPSSSGKSQVLRPLAMTDNKFIHRIDDVTENTFLSGTRAKKGEKEISLLKRIGSLGIMVISDMTVLFSKGSESKNSILAQMRMIHDGEMNKSSGTSSEVIHWEGQLGLLAGCTPSIYQFVEDVAAMGERMIYYRMKPYDMGKATRLALNRKIYGREIDKNLSDLYGDYIKSVVKFCNGKEIPSLEGTDLFERIYNTSLFAAILRTPIQYDKYVKAVTHIPISESPTRVALELMNITKGIMCMQYHDTQGETWDLTEEQIRQVEWCSYSLANEEKRACLRIMASVPLNEYVKTQSVADQIGLKTDIIGITLQNLGAIGVLERNGDANGLSWRIKEQEVWTTIRRLEEITENIEIIDREVSAEEKDTFHEVMQKTFDQF